MATIHGLSPFSDADVDKLMPNSGRRDEAGGRRTELGLFSPERLTENDDHEYDLTGQTVVMGKFRQLRLPRRWTKRLRLLRLRS